MGDTSTTSSPSGPKLKFTRNDFMLAPQKYQRLLYLLATEPRNANALAEAMGMGVDLDIYSKLLSTFFGLWDRNLYLINWCIESEFKNSPAAQAGSLMRGNTFLSKLESEFARRNGTEYLKTLFGDLVREVIKEDQSLDIDASRGNISESILQDRIIKLKLLAQRFFAKITSEDMRKKMPRSIRAIAGLTRIHAQKYYPNHPTSPLIGGFLMLRFFAPALVTPEAFGLLGPDEIPSTKARGNLILVAKVLQNISNGLTFETTKKEQHMKPLDDFVSSQFKLMDLYYQSVADDPLCSINSAGLLTVANGANGAPWIDLLNKPITLDMIQIDKIGLPDLFLLHRLIDRFKPKFLSVLGGTTNAPNNAGITSRSGNTAVLQKSASTNSPTINVVDSSIPTTTRSNTDASSNTPPKGHASFSTLIPMSAVPVPIRLPSTSNASSTSNNTSNTASNTASATSSTSTPSSTNPSSISVPSQPSGTISSSVYNSVYASKSQTNSLTEISHLLQDLGPPPSVQGSGSSKPSSPIVSSNTAVQDWIFLGRPNKAGYTVFYVIVCKIDLHLEIDFIVQNALQYILANITPQANLCVVIDMSWTNSYELRRKFFQNNKILSTLQERIPHDLNKRIREIHLVHPSSVINQFVLFFFKTFVSKKFFSKLHEHQKWKTLGDWIEPAKIDLPEESKSFITKAYRVIKVNAKGKRQHRIVKFTDNSILNIDPSSGTLKNEKLLDDIEDIELASDGSIVLTFSAGSAEREAGKRKKTLLGSFGMKDKADLTTRKYICSNKLDSERFMEDVFEAAYRAQKLQEPLQYKVIKVNDVGKHQDRTFKLTCDSLLNLDGNKIRTEISYVGIKSVESDKNDPKVLWIQLKNEFGPRKIIFDEPQQRNSMFNMLGTRVAQSNGFEDEQAAQMKFETAMWRVGKEETGLNLSASNGSVPSNSNSPQSSSSSQSSHTAARHQLVPQMATNSSTSTGNTQLTSSWTSPSSHSNKQ